MNQTLTSGVGMGTMLLAVLVTLKLTGQIAWSWLWVLTPLWLPFGTFVFLMLTIGALTIHTMIHKSKHEDYERRR